MAAACRTTSYWSWFSDDEIREVNRSVAADCVWIDDDFDSLILYLTRYGCVGHARMIGAVAEHEELSLTEPISADQLVKYGGRLGNG